MVGVTDTASCEEDPEISIVNWAEMELAPTHVVIPGKVERCGTFEHTKT